MSVKLSLDRLSLVPTALLLVGFPLLPLFSDWALAILTLAATLGCVIRWTSGRQEGIKPFVSDKYRAIAVDRIQTSSGFVRRRWILTVDEETLLFEPTAHSFDVLNFRPVTRQDFLAVPRLDVLEVHSRGGDRVEVIYRPEGEQTQSLILRSRQAAADIVLILQPTGSVKTGAIL